MIKRKTFLKRGGPIKKKSISPKQKEARKEQSEKDQLFYQSIWNKKSHRCEVCGCSLGNEMKSYMFDHLLEKSIYPELRYEEANIVLICFKDHGDKSLGHPVPKHVELINIAKERFL